MAELGQRDWSQGWRPDDDAVNGHSQGLLRMDNVTLDENGALTIVKGTDKVSNDLGTSPFRLFSRILNNQKHRYAANIDGTVKRSVNESLTFSNIITGGSVNRCGFGVALGNVLITSGSSKKKDNGTVTNLGIAKPLNPPTLEVLAKPAFSTAFNSQVAIEGTTTTTDATTGRSKIKDINSFSVLAKITNDETEIEVGVTIADSTTIQSVSIEWFLASGAGDASGSGDYYRYEWIKTESDNPFKLGLAQTNSLRVRAGDIERVGGNFQRDWTNVETVILTIQSGISETIAWTLKTDIHSPGQLKGSYTYYQVNVDDNGKYLAKSPVSVRSSTVLANNQDIQVLHDAIPGDANESWFYRRKHGFNGTDTWYRIAVRTSGVGFTDNISDQDALNTGLRVNLNLAVLPNNIIDIIGSYGTRTLYLTSDKLYISDARNPDAIDNRATLDTSGDETERNLWIRKSDANSVLIGTTFDIYEIQGTLELLSDETIDARIIPLGIGNPPIAYNAAAVYNHQIIYMANDGWRITIGANTQSIVGHTRLLYRGDTRHGSEGIGIFAQGTAAYAATVAGGKLYVMAPFVTTNARIMYVYDFVKQYWYQYFAGPLSLFTEEDGVVLAGFADLPSSRFVRELETGAGVDQSQGWDVTLRTPFLDAQLPSQRKDLYVLHVFADTGNVAVTMSFAKDGDDSSYTTIDTLTCNGPEHKTFEINSTAANLSRTISLQFVGTLFVLKLYHWFITFEERPIPLNFLRLRPTNYGIAAKKRIRTIPFVIDTLGNNVTLTPRVDGSNKTTSVLNSSEKRTLFHHFITDINGIDYEYRLQSVGDTVFEFYEAQKPENVEVIPVGKKFDQIGPFHTEKLAKMRQIRIRLIAGTTTISWNLFTEGGSVQSGTITTVVGVDDVYTIENIKTIKGTVWRLELLDTVEFNRYWAKFRFALSGDETNLKQKYIE